MTVTKIVKSYALGNPVIIIREISFVILFHSFYYGRNMSLEIVKLVLGPAFTNCYIIADKTSRDAAVIDPAWDGHLILDEAKKHGWRISQIWLTHAHFDHFGGAGVLAQGSAPTPVVALHPDDLMLWQAKGGAEYFGISLGDPGPEPSIKLFDGQALLLGSTEFNVLHAPGHSQGHVMFYSPEDDVLFCGDVIFSGSIGRTDLPGGDYDTLIRSIREKVLTLPDNTRLLNGHGPETTVEKERRYNPFLN